MKLLETQFVSNADKCGNNTFIQLKKEDGVALYERRTPDNKFKCYEVFIINVQKQGHVFPNGTVVEEAYELYPGKNAFGRTAACCKFLDQAEDHFDRLKKRVNDVVAVAEDDVDDKPIEVIAYTSEADVSVPAGEFTVNMLMQATNMSQPKVHTMVKGWIASGKVVVVGNRASGGRGRPAVVYAAAK
jgi:hypothetical protein